MNRQPILQSLERYEQHVLPFFKQWEHYDRTVLERLRSFVKKEAECFSRHCTPGHLTGSALVLSPDLKKVVLSYHRKLGMWIQLGGHVEAGEYLMPEVALREAHEESGMKKLSLLALGQLLGVGEESVLPFDLDIHDIPPYGNTPGHLHYDVRYIILAHEDQLSATEESLDLQWFNFADVAHVAKDTSIARQIAKVQQVIPLLEAVS